MNKKECKLIGSIFGFIIGIVLLFSLFEFGILILIITLILANIDVEETKSQGEKC